MSVFAKEKVLGPEEEREGHLAHPASQFPIPACNLVPHICALMIVVTGILFFQKKPVIGPCLSSLSKQPCLTLQMPYILDATCPRGEHTLNKPKLPTERPSSNQGVAMVTSLEFHPSENLAQQ